MMTLLEGKVLWDIVEDGYKEPDDWSVLSEDAKDTKEKKKKNFLALSHIQAALDKSISPRISAHKIMSIQIILLINILTVEF